ncbi:SH3 domain-containing protein [Vineibacter terrae]|uniref:SH3 domain-containing protein n=1 Tax=Vineibacter terrae TaxID=2586908 RepID=A0A5C8PU49_9HYPH|nr:SH3 domain-containing protein [Vineibacter terrae]TXL80437.1 SH3 domain-containing protein [Vineibacter terrae]
MRSRLAIPLVACAGLALARAPVPATAQDSSPSSWAVTGVSAGRTLNLRAQPSPSSESVGAVPRDARGLANLGCRELPDQPAALKRWCRVRYKNAEGWVARRFLKEDVDPSTTAAPKSAAPEAATPPAPAPDAGAMAFTCAAAGAVAVMVDKDGTVTHQAYPARAAMQLTISVKPAAAQSAGPVAPATIWQMLDQQGERFEGTIAWGKTVDAREGHWRLDLQSKTLRMVQPQDGVAARFFRFDCE